MNTKMISFRIAVFLIAVLSFSTVSAGKRPYMPKDIVWKTQSCNSSESMPCGGHDIGMNIWVENGDLLFYV